MYGVFTYICHKFTVSQTYVKYMDPMGFIVPFFTPQKMYPDTNALRKVGDSGGGWLGKQPETQ